MTTAWFMTVWPWMGLGAAITLLILLFATDWFRSDTSMSRWRDPAWIALLANVGYMIHNVEEYGWDATGASLGFPNGMKALLGVMPPDTFFLAVNLTMFWLVGPLLALWARRYPSIGLAMPTLMLANALTHLAPMIAAPAYNSGAITAAIIFLPIAIWTYVGVCGKGRLRRFTYWAQFAISVGCHAVLIGTALSFGRGLLAGAAMAPIMLGVSALAAAAWYWIGRSADAKPVHASQARIPAEPTTQGA